MCKAFEPGIQRILDAKFKDIARSGLDEMRAESDRVRSDFARRNLLTPAMSHEIASRCCKHLKIRSEKFNTVLKELAESGVLTISSENKGALLEISKSHFQSDLPAIIETTEMPMFGFKLDLDTYFNTAVREGFERMESEIELLMLTKRGLFYPSNQTITLHNYGTIGAVQSGSDMSAVVNQEIISKKEDLISALTGLKLAITVDNQPNSSEIIETID